MPGRHGTRDIDRTITGFDALATVEDAFDNAKDGSHI
jgi:hypothetical protein